MATASVWAVLGILDTVAPRGPERAALAGAAGLDLDALRAPDDRVPAQRLTALLEAAARRSGDDFLGLHLGQRNAPARFGLLGFVFRSSGSLREAYARMTRFAPLWHDGLRIEVEERAGTARLLTLVVGRVGRRSSGTRHLVELIQTGLLIGARRALDRPIAPRQVSFVHTAPRDVRPLVEFFGERLDFGAAHNEIVLERALLDEALTGAEAGLAAVLTRHAEAMLRRLPASPGQTTELVRQELWRRLPDGVPTLDALARRLALSPRTLQRRLGAEGVSLESIVQEARRELAIQLLGDTSLSASEVALLTGFSEASAFWRAFRRWTGRTPAEYRQGLAGARSR